RQPASLAGPSGTGTFAPSVGVSIASSTPLPNQSSRGKSWRASTSGSPPPSGTRRTSTCASPLPRSLAVTRIAVPRPIVSGIPSTVTVGANGSARVPTMVAITAMTKMTMSARISGHQCQHVEQVAGDPVGGAPDDLACDRVEPDGNPVAVEVPQLLALDPGGAQLGDGNREDGVDLVRRGLPR